MDKFNGESYYIKSIRDYRQWVIRLYIELWVRNEHYTTVYYDLRKHTWGYKRDAPRENVVDFEEVEQETRKIIIDCLKNGKFCLEWGNKYENDKFHEGKELWEFADIGIYYKKED